MRNKADYILVVSGIFLCLAWVAWGVLIFFSDSISLNYAWARGELGDFFGGGLGGISVIFIIYTVWQQTGQINAQQNESFEAGVFRIFQALRAELEGLSARIVSKVIKAKIVPEYDEEDFSLMLSKFQSGDRTVFLRELQKSKFSCAIRSNHDDRALNEAISRFKNIMELLEKSLKETEVNGDDDFSKAMKSTEIYVAYENCFK
tara:strand:- start:66 stop:677 length:612 start_codon:yes stop_codon:yes gene_type:complete